MIVRRDLTLGDSLTIHLLLTSAELCTKQEKLWILSSISYSVVGSSLTAGMKRGIITLSAYRQCHMWVLYEETLEGIWTSQQQQQSALHQLSYVRTRSVSLHFDPFSVFTLEHFCHIPGDIFNCVILSKYFFSCLLLFCFCCN